MKKLVGIVLLSLLLVGCSEVDLGELSDAFNSSNDEDYKNELLLEMLNDAEVETQFEGEGWKYREIYTMTNNSDITFDSIELVYDIFDNNGVKIGSNFRYMKNVTPGQTFKMELISLFKQDVGRYEVTDIIGK